jgi:ATP-binding cassette subfamily F protein uup
VSGQSEETKPAAQKKLSYKDQRELDGLPERIEVLEAQLADGQGEIAAPGFYDQPHAVTHAALEALTKLQAELEVAYARWEELLEESGGE